MEAVILVRLDSIVLSCAFLGVMEKLKRHLGLSNGQKAVITSGDKNPGAQISRKKPTTCVGRRDNCFWGALLWTVRNGKKKVIQERQRKRREKREGKDGLFYRSVNNRLINAQNIINHSLQCMFGAKLFS